MSDKNMEKVLEVKELRTSFFTHVGEVKAIRGVSFDVKQGETVGIVGESGSGKSVTSLSIMRLLQHPGKIVDGEIMFNGEEIRHKSDSEMQNIRGNEIAMIFQDPMTSLNPVYTIGNQIMEAILIHNKISKEEARAKAINALELVGIPSPEARMKNYPHEFSGGMRQRVMIAMALSCEPALLIADEPTTALDVTIQAQILELMQSLKEKTNSSIILITHDLGVVAEVCTKVLVMYGGLIMEEGPVDSIYHATGHPYTLGLMKSIPKVQNSDQKERLVPIEGTPPDLLKPPQGCPFMPRCDYAMTVCAEKLPPFFEIDEDHKSRCWLLHEDAPEVPEITRRRNG